MFPAPSGEAVDESPKRFHSRACQGLHGSTVSSSKIWRRRLFDQVIVDVSLRNAIAEQPDRTLTRLRSLSS
jgi:hypothetical protein